jgi:hypothetical protein
MKNSVSIVGLALPSLLCVSLLVGLNRELRANTSGEAAVGILAGGFLSLLLVFALSCIPNLACTIIAARRKETLWRISALGIPVCAVVTVLAAIMIK